jgi:hypothetical protein
MSLFTGGRTFSTKQIKHSILTKALDADGADLVLIYPRYPRQSAADFPNSNSHLCLHPGGQDQIPSKIQIEKEAASSDSLYNIEF